MEPVILHCKPYILQGEEYIQQVVFDGITPTSENHSADVNNHPEDSLSTYINQQIPFRINDPYEPKVKYTDEKVVDAIFARSGYL